MGLEWCQQHSIVRCSVSPLQSTTSRLSTTQQRCFCPKNQDAGEFLTSVYLKEHGLEHTEEAGPGEWQRQCLQSWPSSHGSWACSCRESRSSREGGTGDPGPQPQATEEQQQQGQGPHPHSYRDISTSSTHPPTVAEPANLTLIMAEVPRFPTFLPTETVEPVAIPDTEEEPTILDPRWQRQWHWQQQGTNDPGSISGGNKGTGIHLWQRPWRVKITDSQVWPEAAQVRETENLCYINAYCNNKKDL